MEASTWGAWEVAARYSYLDLNSGSVNGGDASPCWGSTGIGTAVRWMFNTGYANVSGGQITRQSLHFQARLQVVF
jgi:phosphate-selective porin